MGIRSRATHARHTDHRPCSARSSTAWTPCSRSRRSDRAAARPPKKSPSPSPESSRCDGGERERAETEDAATKSAEQKRQKDVSLTFRKFPGRDTRAVCKKDDRSALQK